MKYLRMLELLEWIDTTLFWPDFGTEEEKQELLKDGFIMIDGGCCLLTSSGEDEIAQTKGQNQPEVKCPKCGGTGRDEKHTYPDGAAAACERCDGYGKLASK